MGRLSDQLHLRGGTVCGLQMNDSKAEISPAMKMIENGHGMATNSGAESGGLVSTT